MMKPKQYIIIIFLILFLLYPIIKKIEIEMFKNKFTAETRFYDGIKNPIKTTTTTNNADLLQYQNFINNCQVSKYNNNIRECNKKPEKKCKIDCIGGWEPEICQADCNQTYIITQNAEFGGKECTFDNGASRLCQPGEGLCPLKKCSTISNNLLLNNDNNK